MHHTISVGDLATLTQLARRLAITCGWLWLAPLGVHAVGFTNPNALTQVRDTIPVHVVTLTQLARRLAITCG